MVRAPAAPDEEVTEAAASGGWVACPEVQGGYVRVTPATRHLLTEENKHTLTHEPATAPAPTTPYSNPLRMSGGRFGRTLSFSLSDALGSRPLLTEAA